MRGIVGKERIGKETDGCPLTHFHPPTERSSSFGLLLLPHTYRTCTLDE
jgi:hypothetical protein